MKKAVFLDRDGVLNSLVFRQDEGVWDSPYGLDEFRLLPGAAAGVRLMKELGYLTVVVSNQPGVAKGKCDPELLERLDGELRAQLSEDNATLDATYYCLHHPEATISEFRVVCDCRKPAPGLLVRAAIEMDIDLANSYMVGDRQIDIEAGHTVGCTTILISGSPVSSAPSQSSTQPFETVTDLWSAACMIQWRGAIRGTFSR